MAIKSLKTMNVLAFKRQWRVNNGFVENVKTGDTVADAFELKFCDGINILIGENGVGKMPFDVTQIDMDENHTTIFDFSEAKEVFEPHILASYHSEYISDVDFVVESEEELLFLEYKNGNIAEAVNPEAFVNKIKSGSLANVLI